MSARLPGRVQPGRHRAAAGKVVTIDGSRKNPVTDGYICAKVRKFGERVYGPDRLLYPAVRSGRKGSGQFKRVTWDEALELVADAIRGGARRPRGAESILPYSYGGSNGLLTQDNIDAQLWRRFGTSRLARTVCAAPTGAANHGALRQDGVGHLPGLPRREADHPLGRQPVGVRHSPHPVRPRGAEARRQARRDRSADDARWRAAPTCISPVRPGTDVAVALAIHRYLFANGHADEAFLREHTTGADELRERAEPWTFERAAEVAGIDAAALEAVAALYAESSPALIRCGWGLERNRNGGNAAMAVLALPAVGGKFGVRGGGYSMSNSASWNIERTWIDAPEPDTRIVNMNHLGRALTEYDDPPVNVLFVYNCNPAATVPDQRRILRGLEREDLFTVVFEQVMTDTALYADVRAADDDVPRGLRLRQGLRPDQPRPRPAGHRRGRRSALERRRVRRALRAARPAERRRAVGRARPDGATCSTSCRRRSAADLRDGAMPAPPCGPAPVQFVDVFPNTPDRKVDLFPAALDAPTPIGLYRYQPDPATAQYPLALISPASERTISSTLGELPRPDVKLLMHPDDARARGLEENDVVRIFNDLGEVHCPLTVAPSIRPGTVSLPKGHLAAQHAQQRHRHRAGAGHAHRSRRRRLLQRRARPGRVARQRVVACIRDQ